MIPDVAIYVGRVMHMRLIPKRHQFRYRVFSLLLDIDRLEETAGRLRLFAYNRFGLLSFRDRDHGPRDGSPLRPWVEEELKQAGLSSPDRILLLSFPRVFGYAFNPLSVYYCYENDCLTAVIYEVKNTFGDQVPYVIPIKKIGALHQHSHVKEMYVSPFIELDQVYRFTLSVPGDQLSLRIKQSGQAGETLIATHNANARPLTDKGLLRVLARHPLMTLKVMAGIHWEALRLFARGVRFNRYSKSEIWAGRPAE